MAADEELVKIIKEGNIEAFSELIDRFENKIYRLAVGYTGNSSDAEDITQEVFIKIYNNIKNYMLESSFSTWVYRITANTCKSFLKRRKIIGFISLDWLYDSRQHKVPVEPAGFEKDVENRETLDKFYSALAVLPDKYKDVLVLREIEELDYQQIAGVTGLSIGTVKSRLSRAKEKIRVKLRRQGEI
ncbi:MAG: RNA polymerase sigma factor [Candidatus Margulisbacteria bacterium]|nr:RNA polymerase sigma factor [Candidatus Margulisiibacteriota bacterium]